MIKGMHLIINVMVSLRNENLIKTGLSKNIKKSLISVGIKIISRRYVYNCKTITICHFLSH